MRAIVSIKMPGYDEETLKRLLDERYWLIRGDVDAELVKQKREELIDDMSENDRAVAKATAKFDLYDEGTKTWGFVCVPNVITFRFKNQAAERLKKVCERLVDDLSQAHRQLSIPRIEFVSDSPNQPPRAIILEQKGQDVAVCGVIVPPPRWRLAIREYRLQFFIGCIMLAIASTLLTITSPVLSSYVFGSTGSQSSITVPSIEPVALGRLTESAIQQGRSVFFVELGAWQRWIAGNLERLATATIVAALVSWLEILLHWLEIRNKPLIRWE